MLLAMEDCCKLGATVDDMLGVDTDCAVDVKPMGNLELGVTEEVVKLSMGLVAVDENDDVLFSGLEKEVVNLVVELESVEKDLEEVEVCNDSVEAVKDNETLKIDVELEDNVCAVA